VPGWRAVLIVWSLLSLWVGALYLRAALDPPPGRVFAGTFHWIDDFYNYASYAQQAEDGAFLFRNKLVAPRDSRAELVNLEWWLVGRISLLLGRRPMLAYRVFALAITLVLVAAVERWLARLGVPDTHRLPALGLVLLGGGLGGLLFEWTDLPAHRCLDMAVAFFPFLAIVANPHFVAGTALLLWSLWAFSAMPGFRGSVVGTVLGTVLGLVRPYDLALLGAVRLGAIVTTEPPRRWLAAGVPLLGLLPVLAWNLRTFFVGEQFAAFRRGAVFPPWIDFVPALAPALALALTSLRRPCPGPAAASARVHLWAWVGLAAAVVAARPGAFSVQFLVGAGVPLLLLAAAGLARSEPARMTLAALVMSTSAVVATRVALHEDPNWFVARERMAAGLALRPLCTADDVVLAPPDVGLYAIGLTRCHAFLAHPAAPDYVERTTAARAFYASWGWREREAWLDERRVTLLVLPGDAGVRPVGWLGEDTPFRLAARVGRGPHALGVYARPGPGFGATVREP
jgi:hypothetical protein